MAKTKFRMEFLIIIVGFAILSIGLIAYFKELDTRLLLTILAAALAILGIVGTTFLTFTYRAESKKKQETIEKFTAANLVITDKLKKTSENVEKFTAANLIITDNIETITKRVDTITQKTNENSNKILELSEEISKLSEINNKISNKLLYPIPNTFHAEIGIAFKFTEEIDTKEILKNYNGNVAIFSNAPNTGSVAELRDDFLSRIKYVGLTINSLDENFDAGFYLNLHELIPVNQEQNPQANLSWYGYNLENDYFFFIAGRIALNSYRYPNTNSLLDYEGKKFKVGFMVRDASIEILTNSETSIYLFSSNAVIGKISNFEKHEGQFIGTFNLSKD